MDSVISQLKKDFYAHLRALQTPKLPQVTSTLNVLSDEEIQELESAWIELTVWKRNQTH
ncbi:3-demethylubiquinone-9 3-methyltransferase [Vibrio mytili]|uniref:3-demethylubiquinone-9 3-methyltransferase n=1 Tax=Vibrio mytili TaxID=50718 RepID=A0A0C3E945_9VIBR|nr:3-demethylubiquinone-9 3-methyltransferase [Vibrio mytili]